MACLLLSLIALGCDNHHYYGGDLAGDASLLRMTWRDWVKDGRPTNYNIGILPVGTYFTYTNIVRGTNGIFRCRFATRSPGYPPGVMAITDQGQVIFVCTNGNVIISPEKYGVDE